MALQRSLVGTDGSRATSLALQPRPPAGGDSVAGQRTGHRCAWVEVGSPGKTQPQQSLPLGHCTSKLSGVPWSFPPSSARIELWFSFGCSLAVLGELMAPEPYTLPSQTLHTRMPLNAGAAPQFGQQSPHRFILCVQRNLGMSAVLVNTNLPTCDLPLLLQAASDLALSPISRRPPVLPQLSGQTFLTQQTTMSVSCSSGGRVPVQPQLLSLSAAADSPRAMRLHHPQQLSHLGLLDLILSKRPFHGSNSASSHTL